MDRRHQVFISSTYDDLKEERHQVIYALLELDCIPAGMELFPASNDDAWSLIKGVIDDSDYYAIVIGGRYGSVSTDGMSYTEKEYEYAVSTNKPIMAFLHQHPGKIESSKTENTDAGKKKLAAFRKKIEAAKHCRYWNTPAELGGLISRGLVQLRKRHPSDGWVQGKFAADETMLLEMNQLRTRIIELEAKSQVQSIPVDGQQLAQGTQTFGWTTSLTLKSPDEKKEYNLQVSWDTLFSYAGASLVGECDEEKLEHRLRLAYWHALSRIFKDRGLAFEGLIMPYVVFDQIKVQLRALGFMASGIRRRAVSDRKVYWGLTSVGETYLMQLRALKATPGPASVPAASPTTSK